MEAIVVLSLLVILAFAAPRWGHSSSDELRSKEQEFASYGVTWRDRR